MDGCSRTTKTLLAMLAAVLLVAGPGCRREDRRIPDPERQDRIIATAAVGETDSQIVVTWFPAPCETFDEVKVEMTQDQARLRVRVTVDVDLCPPAGPSRAVVELGEPLGDRRIFDVAFGDTVRLD